MPGLIRGVGRVAIAAGTATAVSNRVSRRQAGRWAAQAPPEPQYQEPQYQQPAAQQPPRTSTDDKLAQLRQLGELHNSGVLDDAEFELQKSQILNG
jgi:hypothetical protein